MPGHGRSDGLHALVPDWSQHLEALGHWCDYVCSLLRGQVGGAPLPLFLFGSSMGGAVAMGLALRRPESFSGLMLVAPMLRVAPQLRPHPAVEMALKVLANIPIVQDLPLFKGKDVTLLNYAEGAAWRLDEDLRLNALRYWGWYRLRTARTVLAVADEITQQMEYLRPALLVLHGEADPTTAPEFSQEVVHRAAATDKTFELLPGATHGLHYGESPATMTQVYRIMFDWLDGRMTASPAKTAVG